MSIFVQPTTAPPVKTKDTRTIALFYVGILVLMALAQLFTFDKFLDLFTSFMLPGGIKFAHFLAAFIVVSEVFAIPFLLRMRLSPAFRSVSMVLGWLVSVLWIYVATFLLVTHSPIDNVGFLGTVVNVLPSWWAIVFGVAFGCMAAWASWGMWPVHRRK